MNLARCFISSLFLFCISAHAALDLELTQGVDRALPIAVVPFEGQPMDAQADDNIVGVMSADLQDSGRFRLMADAQMAQKPTTLQQVDFDLWRKHNIEDIVIGSVVRQGLGRYRVHFQLVDIYNHNVLVDKTYADVRASALRSLAHHLSDVVYEQLTGQRGVFSTRIAYVLVQRPQGGKPTYRLEISDIDGFNPQALLTSAQPIMSPAWSPDGKRIAYVSFENKKAAIYVQALATGLREKVSDFPGINGAPAWSPDGKRLAIVLTKTGYPKIYVLTLADHHLQRLTSGRALDTEPSWAPDGQSLLFTSDRGGSPQIYRIQLKNKQIRRLTYQGNYNARASFSRDGQHIAMLHRGDGMFNIALLDLTSGRLTELTRSGMGESPSLAPNGQMVVYATHYGGRGVLSEVSIDGLVRLRLPARKGDVREPAWGPF